jgi:NAD(P)-dependent dehydrogenase (short-subunit alcohol dehydrogenase family)
MIGIRRRRLASDVVLVTGATAGLGKELARALAATGATVLLHGVTSSAGKAPSRRFGARPATTASPFTARISRR